MGLRSVLLDIHAALDGAEIEHALIGGLALAAHGAARATVDVDFLADGDRAGDVDRILSARDYETLHRSEDVGNSMRCSARSKSGSDDSRENHRSAA